MPSYARSRLYPERLEGLARQGAQCWVEDKVRIDERNWDQTILCDPSTVHGAEARGPVVNNGQAVAVLPSTEDPTRWGVAPAAGFAFGDDARGLVGLALIAAGALGALLLSER